MSKGEKDYKATLLKLQKQNQDYREKLKSLSQKLDKILQQPKKPAESQDPQEKSLIIETLTKKISILESEIKKLRSKSPNPDRFSLETTLKSYQDSLKKSKSSIKDLQKQISHEKSPETPKDFSEKSYSELKTVRLKLKQLQEKYDQGLKHHQITKEEILKLEDQLLKSQAKKVDILRFDSANNTKDFDVNELKSTLADLETQRWSQEHQLKQEQEKMQNEAEKLQESLIGLKKYLKSKTHEVNTKEFEINELKRQMRSNSARRFSNSPDVGQFDTLIYGDSEFKVLAMVKSEPRIHPGAKKPPRPESNSPAGQRIKMLRAEMKPNI